MNRLVAPALAAALALPSSLAFAQAAPTTTAAHKADHDGVAGHFGATWFSPSVMPAIGDDTKASSLTVVPVGVRYWLSPSLGIDAGLGLAFGSSKTSAQAGGQTTTTEHPSSMAFALHGGVPMALAAHQHFTFLAIPELNFAYSSSTYTPAGRTGQPAPSEQKLSGTYFDIGARAGAEVHFGFMGIPQLTLQGTVGAALAFVRSTFSDGTTETSVSATRFATTVQNQPWSIFTSNVSAIYYF